MGTLETVQGFGFRPSVAVHHFVVTIGTKDESVVISEHYDWEEHEEKRKLSLAIGNPDNQVRVLLARMKWDAIAAAAATEFNARLRKSKQKNGKWAVGQTPLISTFGKELTLLAWAIEDADPSLIPNAIRNWRGLAPEERWWLYTMTNAATGHAVEGRGRGWRAAVRYALTDNPVAQEEFALRQQSWAALEKQAFAYEVAESKKTGEDK